ncbi:MAG: DUF559 domain-containing protein [Prevotella sp.]|nr:DUF559 domain-containing protein [Prevotella sp.]MDE6354145.1 DUF559 domain-containing protein [Prevotella sp.]
MGNYSYCTADVLCYKLLKQFAKHNRQYATQAESILWDFLRDKRLGQQFRRQHIIGMFIADFICLDSMLIIELDGRYHSIPEQQISDAERTAWLNEHGFKVIRFTNDEVICNIKHVLKTIKDNIK